MTTLPDEEQCAWELLRSLRAGIEGFKKQWPWFCAVWAFDYDDPEPLSKLIRTQPIPDELRNLIADIVLGQRKPNKKAAVKTKIPAAKRGDIFFKDCQTRFIRDALTPLSLRLLERDTIRYGLTPIEPIELMRSMELMGKCDLTDKLQDAYGASRSVLTKIRSEGYERARKWPDI